MFLGGGCAAAQAKRAITFDDLISMQRVSEPEVSPDGQWVAFTVATPDMEANRNASNIWVVPARRRRVPPTDAQRTRFQLRIGPRMATSLRFFPRATASRRFTRCAFDWRRGHEAHARFHRYRPIPLVARWQILCLHSGVFPDCKDDACNKSALDEQSKSKVKARIYDHLLYRHWTQWGDGRRSHLFMVAVEGGTPRDLTPGANYDVPPVQRGDLQDIAFSPDSHELCFVAVTDRWKPSAPTAIFLLFPPMAPPRPSASPPIPASMAIPLIHPTENGSPITRNLLRNTKATAGA